MEKREAKLNIHPTVKKMSTRPPLAREAIDREWLLELCREAGADDAGVVSIDRSELDDQRDDIRDLLSETRALVSFVCRMNREAIRTPARSVANSEFYHVHDKISDIGHKIVKKLEEVGRKALNPPMGFPMEVGRDGKHWVISHKPIAVAAGVGRMGIHRNVIHPKYGNFILLGTILTDVELTPDQESRPIDYNPCLECKLCVAACPVGAIGSDGSFNFSACYTHNYREFSGGFTDWVEKIASSKSKKDYRSKVEAEETASMWQSLSFGANYKAAYCLAVCPAGEDVIPPFLEHRQSFIERNVKPLQKKVEPVFVVSGSDAEDHARKRYPHKRIVRVNNGLRARSIKTFLEFMPRVFQKNQSNGLEATYHFIFTGKEEIRATVLIRDKTIQVTEGLKGAADFEMIADSQTWLQVLAKEKHPIMAIFSRKVRTRGSVKYLIAFRKCFPS